MNLSYEVLTNNEFRISLFTNAGRLYESGEETRAAERGVWLGIPTTDCEKDD